jgi:PAS domain S-box-containing protein
MSGSRSASLISSLAARTGRSPGFLRVKAICGYVFAVVLPWLAADLSFRTPALLGMRLALNFSAIAVAAIFFGVGPALVAIGVSAMALEFYLPPSSNPDSAPAYVATRIVVILISGGLILLMIKQMRDAERELRAALATLQEQSAALSQAQQASRSAAWTFHTDTGRPRWFEGGADIFGLPHEEIMARGSVMSLIVEEDRATVRTALERTTRTGDPLSVEFRVVWPNGEVHWLESRGVPLPSNPKVWRGATIDITERKQAEAALIRSEKLAVAGRLAASIAHEINNPLEAVTNLCYLAKLTAVDPETRSYITMAEDELSRVAHITSQTLRFHRQQTAAVETDLGETLRSIVTLYEQRLAQAGIAVSVTCEAAAPLVCYAGEMRQVLANLIGNAIDAMPNGGVLRLRLRPSTDWRTGAPAVRVTVADSGHGMSEEIRERIFEPFYTTKGDVGTGLGLWISAGIVEKHNGRLNMRSTEKPEGGGSVFTLLLPYSASILANRSISSADAA